MSYAPQERENVRKNEKEACERGIERKKESIMPIFWERIGRREKRCVEDII